MKLRNKFLLLVGAASLTLGSVGANQLNCFAMIPEQKSMNVVFVGKQKTDKANILNRLAGGTASSYNDGEFHVKLESTAGPLTDPLIEIEGKNFQLIDTPGQEKFKEFMWKLVRNADVIFIVIEPDSLDNMRATLQSLIDEVEKEKPDAVRFVLVNTRDDRLNEESNSHDENISLAVAEFVEEVRANCSDLGVEQIFQVNAQTGEGISKLKDSLGEMKLSSDSTNQNVDAKSDRETGRGCRI